VALVDYIRKLVYQASKISPNIGKMYSAVALFILGFDHFFIKLPSKIISLMYLPVIGTAISLFWDALKKGTNPHVALGKKCLKCDIDMVYTGLKCPNCDYIIDFEKSK
jgi:hypothetical protein